MICRLAELNVRAADLDGNQSNHLPHELQHEGDLSIDYLSLIQDKFYPNA
jgi:hypothetical protein